MKKSASIVFSIFLIIFSSLNTAFSGNTKELSNYNKEISKYHIKTKTSVSLYDMYIYLKCIIDVWLVDTPYFRMISWDTNS